MCNIVYLQLRYYQTAKQIINSYTIQMEIQMNFGFLTSIDTSKFSINETKKQIQSTSMLQYRNNNQRPLLIQIAFAHSFPHETLISNVEIQYNDSNFGTNFQGVAIEVSSLSNRGHFMQLINLVHKKETSQSMFTGIGFTHSIRVNLLLKTDPKKKNVKINQKQFQQSILNIIKESVKDINVYGISVNSNPNSILLTKLLNISETFKKYNMLQQTAQTDFLAAVSLINARRFVQAAEILKKVSKFYVQKYNSSKSATDYNRNERSWTKDQDDSLGISLFKSSIGTGRIIEGNKFLQKAAKIQLLIAQTVSHPSLIMQKLQAYCRCNSFSNGNISPSPLNPDFDIQNVSGNIFPQIIIFLLKTLSDKLQPFRVASLKSIQFFIQTIGCSIGAIYVQILKQVVSTYPNNFVVQRNENQIPYSLFELQSQKAEFSHNQMDGNSTKNKFILDHYHHLLQTLLSLLPQISKRINISAFSDIILPCILTKSPSLQLKLYMLRFAEKAISISGADLNIEVSFVGVLIGLCEQKNVLKSLVPTQSNNKSSPSNIKQAGLPTGQNKHAINNIVFFSHKILNILKLKIINRYSSTKLQPFLQWINKTLNYLGQNELLTTNNTNSLFIFTTILQFIISIYSNLRDDIVKLKFSPIQTILYFTNMILQNNQTGLSFQKILQSLYVLLRYHTKVDDSFQLHKQIVQRILQKSKQNNLALKQLQILIKTLDTIDNQQQLMLQWLHTYLGCIPHSTFDETYQVFNILFAKGIKKSDRYAQKNKLYKKLVKTLLDQYTVKGKAHQQAKQMLIQNLIKEKPQDIIELFKICLFQNLSPKSADYYSKRKINAPSKINKQKEHHFDSKSYRIDLQLFMEKISFTQLLLTKMSTFTQISQILVEDKFLLLFFQSIKRLLQTNNMKVKSKALSLVNHYLAITANIWKQNKIKLATAQSIIVHTFNISKILILKLKQSKLMYNTLYNILILFRCFQDQIIQNYQNVNSIYQKLRSHIKKESFPKQSSSQNQNKIKLVIFKLILFSQLLKIWPIISQCAYSPWQSVREMYFLLLFEMFKEGFLFIPDSLKKQTMQILKSLLTNLLSSNQHNERQSGLKLFGCLIGLRCFIQNKSEWISKTIASNLVYFVTFTNLIFQLTYDWNTKNAEISQNLCQLCISKEGLKNLQTKKKQLAQKKIMGDPQGSCFSINLMDQLNIERKNASIIGSNNSFQNILLKDSQIMDQEVISLQDSYFPLINEDAFIKISQFRNLIQKQIQAKSQSTGEKQSFLQQNEEQFYDIGEEKMENMEAKEKVEDEQLQFEDLGIIQLDDEQWGQQEELKQQKALQRLAISIKKNNKLSPGIINNSKPQRIRSKRFHQNEFDFRQKIIVDELQQKISIPNYDNNSLPQQMYPSQLKEKQLKKNREQIKIKNNQPIQKKELNFMKNKNIPFNIGQPLQRQKQYNERQLISTQFKQKQIDQIQQCGKQVKNKQRETEQKQFDQVFKGRDKQKQSKNKVKKGGSNKKRKYSVGK